MVPAPYGEKLFLIKDLFRSAGENNVVLPSLQKLELIDEIAISRFEGLENILPNLRILESSARVDKRTHVENLLNSFLYLVRNFPKLEEIRFKREGDDESSKNFKPMNARIPRLLKKEKPSLIIYYPETCQYEPVPEKEGKRRDREEPPQQRNQRTTTKTRKPATKKAVRKTTTTTTKKKRKAKVEKKKKLAGKKIAAKPKGKKNVPTTKKAGKKKK